METPTARGHTAAMYEVAFALVDDQWREFAGASDQLMMRALIAVMVLPLFAFGLVLGG